MEYLCEQSVIMSKERFDLFLSSVPKSFKNYFIVLGPEKCKAMKYQKVTMEGEYQKQLNNQGVTLDDRIYDKFHAGERWRKAAIKEELQQIYAASNYIATAKAKDLEQWFELKEIQMRVKGTSDRESGFLLVRRIK